MNIHTVIMIKSSCRRKVLQLILRLLCSRTIQRRAHIVKVKATHIQPPISNHLSHFHCLTLILLRVNRLVRLDSISVTRSPIQLLCSSNPKRMTQQCSLGFTMILPKGQTTMKQLQLTSQTINRVR